MDENEDEPSPLHFAAPRDDLNSHPQFSIFALRAQCARRVIIA